MVKGLSQLFAAGPAVVEAIGEASDKESLGGSVIHTRNGVVDEEVASEAEAFARCAARPDFDEGIGAFLEKRKPRFNG